MEFKRLDILCAKLSFEKKKGKILTHLSIFVAFPSWSSLMPAALARTHI